MMMAMEVGGIQFKTQELEAKVNLLPRSFW